MDPIKAKRRGARIRKAREEKDMTKGKLASIARVSTLHIDEIERGDAEPDMDVLIKICNALSISVDYVLGSE